MISSSGAVGASFTSASAASADNSAVAPSSNDAGCVGGGTVATVNNLKENGGSISVGEGQEQPQQQQQKQPQQQDQQQHCGQLLNSSSRDTAEVVDPDDAEGSESESSSNESDSSDAEEAPLYRTIPPQLVKGGGMASLPANLAGVAEFIQSPKCRSIVLLTGAGISVSAGIPDYRSAGGFYDSLRPDSVTATDMERELMRVDPAAAVEKEMFLQNPFPLLELKREFILGTQTKRWKATIAHRFIELLHKNLPDKLTRVYTQNIDGLERQCETLPKKKVLPVHGSMGHAACMTCGSSADFDTFCNNVRKNIKDVTGRDRTAPMRSTPILCDVCGCATVKPTVVLFHEKLPMEFFDSLPRDLSRCDLLLIMGTSLSVGPANSVAFKVPYTALRVVVNHEPVGRMLGIRYGVDATRDYFAQGSCDEVCLELIGLLGWMDQLEKVMDELPVSNAALVRKNLERKEKSQT